VLTRAAVADVRDVPAGPGRQSGLFTLRDADSIRDSLFHQFGVLRDDYSAQPAFERLRGLFRELR
jgi:hypothetical protein